MLLRVLRLIRHRIQAALTGLRVNYRASVIYVEELLKMSQEHNERTVHRERVTGKQANSIPSVHPHPANFPVENGQWGQAASS